MIRLTGALRRLLGRRFAQEVFILQVGSFATMGMQFVASVAIANLLGPVSLGVYAQALALLSLVNLLANLAVGQSLITSLSAAHARRDEAESLRILAYFIKVGFTVSLVEAAVGLGAGVFLGSVVLDDPEIGYLARVLFISPPLLVVFNMVVLALQSTRQLLRLTLLENGALIGTALLNVSAVVLGYGVEGLLFTVAFAPLLTSAAALLVYRSTAARVDGLPGLGSILRAAPSVPYSRYFAFSVLVSADKNLSNLIAQTPILLLARLASDSQVAYFKVAYNLMNFLAVPLAPISRNLYAKLSEIMARRGPEALGSSLLQVSLGAGAISTVATAAMLLASPFILMIYRPEYMAAQAVMYALGLRFVLLGFGVGLGPVYQVLGRMKLALATKVVPGIIMVGAGLLLIGSQGAVGAALTIVVAYLVGDLTNAFLVPWMVKQAKRGNG